MLVEWTFIMDDESYTVGLLHSQKTNPYSKSTKRLIVNGQQLWAQRSTATQFCVLPEEDMVLGVSIRLQSDLEEQRFVYLLTINGKEHEAHFEEWKAAQMFMH